MFAPSPDGSQSAWVARRNWSLIVLVVAAACLLGACAVDTSGATGQGTVRPLPTSAQSASTRFAAAGSTAPVAAAQETATAQSTATTRPTPSARPTATAQPTATTQPTAAAQPTAQPTAQATTQPGVVFFASKTNSDAGFAVLSILVLLLCFAVIGIIVWMVARSHAHADVSPQESAAGSTPAAPTYPGAPPPGAQSPYNQPPGAQSPYNQPPGAQSPYNQPPATQSPYNQPPPPPPAYEPPPPSSGDGQNPEQQGWEDR